MSRKKKQAQAPAWMDVEPVTTRFPPSWAKWPAEAREMLDELIHHMRDTGSYWTPQAVGDRLTRELAERGARDTRGKPVRITQNMLTAYCVKVHGFKWSSMRP